MPLVKKPLTMTLTQEPGVIAFRTRCRRRTSQPAGVNLAIDSYNPSRFGRRLALAFVVRSAAAADAHPAMSRTNRVTT